MIIGENQSVKIKRLFSLQITEDKRKFNLITFKSKKNKEQINESFTT